MNVRRRSNATSSTTKNFHVKPERGGHQLDQQQGGEFSNDFTSDKRIWAFCLVFRALNSLLVQTYFNPDEHWQALEVAHRIVFGYGHLTWEWKKGIRSYLHPLMFALLYKTMAFIQCDTPWLMMKAPRLMQSLISSVGDVYLYKLSSLIFDGQLFSHLSNWFMFFCIPRTLSNSLETVLSVMGLYYWISFLGAPKYATFTSRRLALFLSALACAVRPTSAVIWLYVGFLDLFGMQKKLKFLVLEVLPIGSFAAVFTCILDYWMYGTWTFVPLNFLKFNFLSSGGDYYGTHAWHWYFTQGFPAMVFTFLPYSLYGIYYSKEWRLSGLIAWVLGIYSLLGHKEFRFVLPVLPIALIFSGYTLAAFSRHKHPKRKRSLGMRCPSRMQMSILFLIATNVPMALYMSLVHQRGTEDVMHYLSKEARDGKVNSILFLMPCHSTPYYSALHYNVTMHFLDCTPSDVRGTLDESDQFMANPVDFTSEMFKHDSLPSHIVVFDSEEIMLRDILSSRSFREEKRFFHSHFKVDRDLQGSVIVYALS
ncbi:Dol-P-Man:Man(7)GlcNAc(2)-PP-Dol alpha-1,6-mannosyltransferase [Apostasia shenzhenica]|uniref:Mannosyltransferase n=1 Tax=Apostasia shenzhenica TaxID=1088818 RepID=A0A2I0AIH5_9ASPA|nr:Dol-P-Man:Man(7)GlcNAc(2)-PP-Dol alpha-1,6-mannosyltransferase [Apostasia shenzhenica]